MLFKTRGIVFKTTNYGETSIITQIFTENFGLQSYIINGAKKPKAKISLSMLQPLHLLQMVVYHKNNGGVQHIKELKNAPVLLTIPYNIVKSSIAIFLNEVLYRAVRQQWADEALFKYIFNAVEWLDNSQESITNFHLLFLLQASRYLGFYPDLYLAGDADYFDMKNGTFSRFKPNSLYYLSPPHTANFAVLVQCTFQNLSLLAFNNDERRYLVQKLLDYYALHLESFGNIHSHEILEEVLSVSDKTAFK